MARLARLVDDSDPAETVMVLGGEYGAVTLHVSLCGIPQSEVLHSPREFPGWEGPRPCRYLEGPCWCRSSITAEEMITLLLAYSVGEGDEALWQMMEHAYKLYLEGGRR